MSEQLLLPVPWIPHAATEFLNTIVKPDWMVFEWGSGGSTWYWSLHCNSVVSVEDDPVWHAKMVQLIEREKLTNVDLRLIPGEPPELHVHPDEHHPSNYYHVRWDHKLHPFNYTKYATIVEQWPLDSFDLVFIDAMARSSCFFHGVSRVKPGGWLLWDNSDYEPTIRFVGHLMNGWERHDFHGHGPYLEVAWKATIWRKPQS